MHNKRFLELTVPTNTPDGLEDVRRRNQLKPSYITLLNDLKAAGLSSVLETIEIGTPGHYTNQTIASLHTLLLNLKKSAARPAMATSSST